MVLFEKFGAHQPLNRQAERYARKGVPISLFTLADQVGAGRHVLEPILQRIEQHVFASQRLHGDDTTVPVLAKGRTETGRCWTYVRDDRPFGGSDPLAAMFYFSRDRKGAHPQAHLADWSGVLQADAFSGYNDLYSRTALPISSALCWAHGRRGFYELANLDQLARRRAQGKTAVVSPIAVEVVRRMDLLFTVERAINGLPADERLAARREHSAGDVADLRRWSAGCLDAGRTGQAPRPRRRPQGHRLHAEALARLQPVPRQRPSVPHQQRGGARLRGLALGRRPAGYDVEACAAQTRAAASLSTPISRSFGK